MHLALDLGYKTVHELETTMTVAELDLWFRYSNAFLLPTRRIEMQIAQVSLVIARTMGGGKRQMKLQDFLFDRYKGGVADEDDDNQSRQVAAAAVGALSAVSSRGVYRLGQGRKKAG